MKRLAIYSFLFLLLVGIGAGLFLYGRVGTYIVHVDGEEFIRSSSYCDLPASLGKTRYIGVSDDRAYLEEHNVLGPRTIVVWTRLEELPEDLAKELREGKPPWTNWQCNVEERTTESTPTK